MKFGVALLSLVANHASDYGLYAAKSSVFQKTPLHLSCGLDVKNLVSRGKIVQGTLNRRKRSLALTCIVSAIRNGPVTTTSGFSSDDQSNVIPENGKDSEEESTASSLYLSEDHSQHSQILGNQGNLVDKLKAIHMHALAMEQWNASQLKLCHRRHAKSAANLIHYLALRSLYDNQLKDDLSLLGPLNLETINPYVIAGLSTGIHMLENLNSNSSEGSNEFTASMMMNMANYNRDILLGPLEDERRSHIMVTIGEEAIANETFIDDVLKKGVTIVRINCAYGDQCVWSKIIKSVRLKSQMLEKPCRILMDLGGPKMRTSEMKSGPCVVKISPKKNACGNVIKSTQIWVTQKGEMSSPPANVSPDVVLYVEFLTKPNVGDIVRFSDARGKHRSFKITKNFHGGGFMAECSKTAYVKNGTKLYTKGNKFGYVVDVAPTETFVRLRVGDSLVITRDFSSMVLEQPIPRVGCSSDYLFDSVKPGEPIAFDDGKIWGVIKGTSDSEIVVSITRAGPQGTKLGPHKSINVPESEIQYEGLNSKDIIDLEFVGAHADMVGFSFVRDASDVIVLCKELKKRKLDNLGVVLKIETKDGLENLHDLLLEAMKLSNPLGVMIARGDLAVECGFETMADNQEKIVSICNAAHVPVIWATQVLESLLKTGVPTRAEITDVACGRRASCIMLNKGKHILEAISTLYTILKATSTKITKQ